MGNNTCIEGHACFTYNHVRTDSSLIARCIGVLSTRPSMIVVHVIILLSSVFLQYAHAAPRIRDAATESKVSKSNYLNFVNDTGGLVHQWHISSQWACNIPSLLKDYSPYMTVFVNSESYGIPRQRILICGSPSEGQPTETWIFDLVTDSWDKLDVSGPKQRPGYVHSLVTLCNTTVLLVSVSSAQRPEVWAFNSKAIAWTKVRDDNNPMGASLALPVSGRFVAVSVPIFKSSLTCSDAVLAIAGNDSVLTLWKLTFDEDQNRTIWRELKQNCDNECPSKLIMETAAVSEESGALYMLGFGTRHVPLTDDPHPYTIHIDTGAVWSYSVLSERWMLVQWQPPDDSVLHVNNILSHVNMWSQCQQQRCVATVQRDDYFFREEYVVYSKEIIWTYHIDIKRLSIEKFVGSGPDSFSGIVLIESSCARHTRALAYSSSRRTGCRPILLRKGVRNWVVAVSPEIAPTSTKSSAVAVEGSSLYTISLAGRDCLYDMFGPESSELMSFDLWLLDLDHMRWTRLEPYEPCDFIAYFYVSGIILHGRIYIACFAARTGFNIGGEDVVPPSVYHPKYLHALGYMINRRRWIRYDTIYRPPGRREHSMVALDDSSLLVFGGYSNYEMMESGSLLVLNDTWMLTVSDPSRGIAFWDKLESNDSFPCPSGRFKHTMVRVDTVVVLYGGQDQQGRCLNDVWHFNISTRLWEKPESDMEGPALGVSSTCYSTGTAVGKQAFFVISCSEQICSPIGLQLWMYQPSSYLWIMASVSPDSNGDNPTWYYSLFQWKGKLMIFDRSRPQILFSYLGCPAGYSSSNISSLSTPCAPCSFGYFSSSGSRECTPCPNGLMTKSAAATSIYQCNVCENYCDYGICLVVQSDGQPTPVCQCTLGFSGSHCQYPTYYLITVGVIVFLAVLAAGIIVPYRIRRKRRKRERALVDHVAELMTVWQIRENEVAMHERIGRGGYGEVFRAEYRDITVAVKLLRLTTEESVVDEFEREIKFMQTIRHPNIVLFLGA